jgi:hypothetical protein
MIVSLGIALLVRSRLVDTFARVSDPQERYLATTYVDALVTPLEIALLVAAVIGLATAVAAWLLGRRGRRTAVPARS